MWAQGDGNGGHCSVCILSFCSCKRELLLLAYCRTQVVCRNARQERRLFMRVVPGSQLIVLARRCPAQVLIYPQHVFIFEFS